MKDVEKKKNRRKIECLWSIIIECGWSAINNSVGIYTL